MGTALPHGFDHERDAATVPRRDVGYPGAVRIHAAAAQVAPYRFIEYQAELTSAPNFAFDLCVSRFRADQMQGVDLSTWKVALNGAEPIHADTIARFAETFGPYGFDAGTMSPGYGLAEATLLVASGRRGGGSVIQPYSREALRQGGVAEPKSAVDTQYLVCQWSLYDRRAHSNRRSRQKSLRVEPYHVGEVWVSGPNVAQGYWCDATATSHTFKAQIADNPGRTWLRTGDLGFLDERGELYITGRIKDLIIIRGLNHYPQDIEKTVQSSHPALRQDCGAAFATADAEGREQLVVIQEVERTFRSQINVDEVTALAREAVTKEHEIAVHCLALIRPATLRKRRVARSSVT